MLRDTAAAVAMLGPVGLEVTGVMEVMVATGDMGVAATVMAGMAGAMVGLAGVSG